MMSVYLTAFHRLRMQLQDLYDPAEAGAITKEILLHITGKGYTQALATDVQLTETEERRLEDMSNELRQGRPLQYVLGHAWFFNRQFKVNEQVLIPRPETEELVQWIIDEHKDRVGAYTILDIGTGSGCIPITLKLALNEAVVTSCDISSGALGIAGENAAALHAAVTFIQLDFLNEADRLPTFDIIVSNPPYIPAREYVEMHTNVRDHEPGTALFVPDEDPLLFYKAIALSGKIHLNRNGAIYCEQHKDFAVATRAMFETMGYKTELRKDMNGHWRMLKAETA